MAGLAKICKQFGRLIAKGNNGNTAEWVYDYEKDKPVLKSVKKGLKQAEEINKKLKQQ
jgi:hypothetical protein